MARRGFDRSSCAGAMCRRSCSQELSLTTSTQTKHVGVLCAVTLGYKVTSDAIDSMWHTFLLFTKDYRDFCMR